jgi:hypothetical protein
MPPVAHVAHRPTAIPLALSPFTPPPMQPQTDGSTLFPALQTPPPTLPPVGPPNCSTQNRPSSPCPSRLIPHSPLAPAAIRLPRFRALALFGRLPSARVDGSSCRRPKTCTELDNKTVEYIHQHRIWFIVLGAALIALGLLVAASSVTATIVSIFFLAGVLMLESVIRIVAAFSAREWAGSFAACACRRFLHGCGRLDLPTPGQCRGCLDAPVCHFVPGDGVLSPHHLHLVSHSQLGRGRLERRGKHRSRLDALELVAGIRALVYWPVPWH